MEGRKVRMERKRHTVEVAVKEDVAEVISVAAEVAWRLKSWECDCQDHDGQGIERTLVCKDKSMQWKEST